MNQFEGKTKLDLSTDDGDDFELSCLFNTVLNNKLIRQLSENVYESFSQ